MEQTTILEYANEILSSEDRRVSININRDNPSLVNLYRFPTRYRNIYRAHSFRNYPELLQYVTTENPKRVALLFAEIVKAERHGTK